MEDNLTQALEIVKAQACVRVMNADEIVSMINSLAKTIGGDIEVEETVQEPAVDPKKAIKEKSIICLECGKSFKILTKRHLETHGLTVAEYKEKWGYKKGQSLACKSLSRQRKKKMAEMELWTRRNGVKKEESKAEITEQPKIRKDDNKKAILDRDKPKTVEKEVVQEPVQKTQKDFDAIADKIIIGH